MYVFSRLFREDDPKWLRFSQGSGRNMSEFNYEGVTLGAMTQNALVDYMRRKAQAVGKKFKSRLRFFMVGTCKWNHHEWCVGQGFGKSPSSPKSICRSPLEKVGHGESHYCELSQPVPRGLRLGFETVGGGSSLAAAWLATNISTAGAAKDEEHMF